MKKKDEWRCLSGNTKILLENGDSKNIKDIKVDEEVLSYNIEENIIEKYKVEKITSSKHKCINSIKFNNKTIIKSTTDHPYFVINKGWASFNPQKTKKGYGLNVFNLEVGDKCLCFNNRNISEIKILSIDTIFDSFTMYLISGGRNKCFFANNILVSDENL